MVSLKGTKQFQASFYGIDGKKMKLNTNEEVKAVLERLDGKGFYRWKGGKKERRRMRHFHTTSSMQMDAANKINFPYT